MLKVMFPSAGGSYIAWLVVYLSLITISSSVSWSQNQVQLEPHSWPSFKTQPLYATSTENEPSTGSQLGQTPCWKQPTGCTDSYSQLTDLSSTGCASIRTISLDSKNHFQICVPVTTTPTDDTSRNLLVSSTSIEKLLKSLSHSGEPKRLSDAASSGDWTENGKFETTEAAVDEPGDVQAESGQTYEQRRSGGMSEETSGTESTGIVEVKKFENLDGGVSRWPAPRSRGERCKDDFGADGSAIEACRRPAGASARLSSDAAALAAAYDYLAADRTAAALAPGSALAAWHSWSRHTKRFREAQQQQQQQQQQPALRGNFDNKPASVPSMASGASPSDTSGPVNGGKLPIVLIKLADIRNRRRLPMSPEAALARSAAKFRQLRSQASNFNFGRLHRNGPGVGRMSGGLNGSALAGPGYAGGLPFAVDLDGAAQAAAADRSQTTTIPASGEQVELEAQLAEAQSAEVPPPPLGRQASSSGGTHPLTGASAEGQAMATDFECNLRQYVFMAFKVDASGNKCYGLVVANICQGGCDTGEIADWLFPHKKSIHKVCTHGSRVKRRAALTKCTSDSVDPSLREYHYVDAENCACQKCNSADTTCLGSLTQPYLPRYSN